MSDSDFLSVEHFYSSQYQHARVEHMSSGYTLS